MRATQRRLAGGIAILLLILCCTILLPACEQHRDSDVLATINGREVTWGDIKDDVAFVAGTTGVAEDDVEYESIVADVLNSFLIDIMCEMECETRGVQYDRAYYGQCLLSLYGAHGSEEALLKKLKSFGLDHSYAEKVCRKQALKAALYADVISKIEIEESELVEYYFTHMSEFRYEEVRDIYTVYYGNEADAKEALEIVSDSGFLAFYEQVDVSDEGVIGPNEKAIYKTRFPKVTKDEFDKSVADLIFGITDQSYYPEPIQCTVGYFLVFVDGVYTDYTFSYDEMAPYIEEALIEARADDVAKQFFADLNERYNVQILEQ